MKSKILKEYAKLIAQKGVNVQPGQEVWITASLDQPKFVEVLAKECYQLGAKKVVVDWTHDKLSVLDSKFFPILQKPRLNTLFVVNIKRRRWLVQKKNRRPFSQSARNAKPPFHSS